MADERAILLSVCTSLARLQVRVLDKLAEGRRMPNGVIRRAIDSRWEIADLVPASPWFDQLPSTADLSNTVQRIALVQAHLLGMVECGEIDARKACLIVQHICGSGPWSAMALRLAERLGVTLRSHPVDELGHTSPALEPFPRRAAAKKKPPP